MTVWTAHYSEWSMSQCGVALWNVLLSFCQFDKHGSLGSREPRLKSCLHQSCLWGCLQGIFLINNWYERMQLTVDSAAPEQIVLGCIKKKKSKLNKTQSKPGTKTPWFLLQDSALHPCLGFPRRWTIACKPNKSFISCFWSQGLTITTERT